jgi:acylpyruvate hydrolase
MRFVAFREEMNIGLAVSASEAGGFFGLTTEDPDYPGDLATLLANGAEALASAVKKLGAGRKIDLTKIDFLPPLSRAEKIICVGLNYADHSAESGFKLPDYPTLFARFSSSFVGHGAPLVKPGISDQFDYEGELVAIIGKGGRDITRSTALDHVFGYSVFNDGSVRDYQMRTPQWTVGKNFDGTGAFGPFLVTADEAPNGAKGLMLQTRLNGVIVQNAPIDDMVFSVAELVSIISEVMTLAPGDIIVTGTPSGVGAARKPPLYMKKGDLVEVEIGNIGLLRNHIINQT